MTTDDILRMAREAGFQDRDGTIRTMHSSGAWVGINEELERFAALAAAAERDECAKVAVKSDRERIKAGIMALTMTAESCRGDAGVDTARKALALRIVTLIDGHGDLVLNEAGKRMAESLAEGHQ